MSPTAERQRMYHPTLSSPVTRRIWSSPDAILLFFAGGAAEFAAIKAVDWLFFTGRLPAAPVERFFETVRFAQGVFFADPAGATDAVERINRIHRSVEEARGGDIPQWAYQDMLFRRVLACAQGEWVCPSLPQEMTAIPATRQDSRADGIGSHFNATFTRLRRTSRQSLERF